MIGAFAGAPLLARELETGTFRFAWTQGVGRMRWLVALLVPGALGVAAIIAAFGALVSWYKQPLVDSGIPQRLHASVFPVTGVAVAGWALAGFALGVLAGLVLRRVVPALAATLAPWTGLAFLASPCALHYQAPLTTSSLQLASSDLQIDQWWTHGGVRVGDAQINQVLQAIGVQSSDGGGSFRAGPGSSSGRPRPIPAPARLHPMDQLPARQPLLDLPVDRVRLAHRSVAAAPRRDALAGTSPERLGRGLPAGA